MDRILTENEWAALSPESRHKLNAHFLADAGRQKEIQTLTQVAEDQLQKLIQLAAKNKQLMVMLKNASEMAERFLKFMDYVDICAANRDFSQLMPLMNQIRPALRNLIDIQNQIMASFEK